MTQQLPPHQILVVVMDLLLSLWLNAVPLIGMGWLQLGWLVSVLHWSPIFQLTRPG